MKYLFLILCFFSVFTYAASVEYRADASLYSEPIAIDAFLDDWQDPDFKSGKYAFAHGLMQLSVQQDQWNLGWLWRYDYILKFSPDMAKLYYQIENDLPLDAESMYELTLHAQYLERIGARIAYDWVPQSNWILTAGVSALYGRHFVDGQFNAFGETNLMPRLADRVQWLNGQLNYYYDQPALKEDELGLGDFRAKEGYGYALDLTLQGEWLEKWYLKFQLEDIFSYMYWDEAPYSQYQATFDQNSRPRINLTGTVATDKSYKQKIPYKISTELLYNIHSEIQLGVSSFSNPFTSLWQMHFLWQPDSLQLGLHFEPQTKSLGVSFRHENIGMKYLTDNLNTNQAHRMEAYLFAQYQW
ncbi:hypothetical protein [Acinetobacter towneri]|uniref:hypothetical protein n=1 Tax=Acinetobacter towneri TaxID=202956 RepID=UPI001D195BD0|nr:hypothetical protein [Acinetobacter towneri]